MYYQVLSPYVTQIEGDTLAEAIKLFVKVNYNNQIRNMIIADQQNKYTASINYYNKNNKNKIGIKINKNDGYVVFPNTDVVQPLYKESTDGTSSEVVGTVLPINLPQVHSSNIVRNRSITNATPLITSPGMISTTNNKILSTPNNNSGLLSV